MSGDTGSRKYLSLINSSRKLERLTKISAGLLVIALIAVLPLPVYADQVFHTEQLPLILTSAGAAAGHPVLLSGHVVDIHANGPQIYALERYMLGGAKPDTSYQVKLNFSLTGCEHPQKFLFPTALLTTNAQGDAHGNFTFTPATVRAAGLHAGMTLGITWLFVSDGITAYQTPSCIDVGLD